MAKEIPILNSKEINNMSPLNILENQDNTRKFNRKGWNQLGAKRGFCYACVE